MPWVMMGVLGAEQGMGWESSFRMRLEMVRTQWCDWEKHSFLPNSSHVLLDLPRIHLQSTLQAIEEKKNISKLLPYEVEITFLNWMDFNLSSVNFFLYHGKHGRIVSSLLIINCGWVDGVGLFPIHNQLPSAAVILHKTHLEGCSEPPVASLGYLPKQCNFTIGLIT